MEKRTYNRENWTGDTATVSIFKNTYNDSHWGRGSWSVDGTSATVVVDEYHKIEVWQMTDGLWLAHDSYGGGDYDREDKHPVVAALKLASNII